MSVSASLSVKILVLLYVLLCLSLWTTPGFKDRGFTVTQLSFFNVDMNRASLSEADERDRCLTGHLILFPFCVKSRQDTVDKGPF